MKVKSGDIVEFIALTWSEPQWEFDYPTVVLQPRIAYSPNGEPAEKMIEDMAIDLSCGDDVKNEDVRHEFEWRGWKIARMQEVAANRLKGEKDWISKRARVTKQCILFKESDGILDFEILETIEK